MSELLHQIILILGVALGCVSVGTVIANLANGEFNVDRRKPGKTRLLKEACKRAAQFNQHKRT